MQQIVRIRTPERA